MPTFTVSHKTVSVFPGAAPGAPAIYLNTCSHEGRQVFQIVQAAGCMPFSLVAVDNLHWNHDMAPWDSPAAFQNGEPFTGGADGYLRLLVEEIMPKAEKELDGPPLWRGIAGYSLAGLFALYTMYRTGLFARAASISGSLWFPGFKEYVFSHTPKRRPDCVYLSVGDREGRARSPVLKMVQQNTQEIQAFYQSQGIDAMLQLNPGNHFAQEAERTAAGLKWLLEQ